jgi:hypothetical protein
MNLGFVFAFVIVSFTVAFFLQNPEQNRVHVFAWTFEGSLDGPDTWPAWGVRCVKIKSNLSISV